MNNIDKALAKLELFPTRFLGVNVNDVRKNLLTAKEELKKLGRERMNEFPGILLPKI